MIASSMGPLATDQIDYSPPSTTARGTDHSPNAISSPQTTLLLTPYPNRLPWYDGSHKWRPVQLPSAYITQAGRCLTARTLGRNATRSAMKVKRDRRERISRHEPFGWDFGPDGMLVETGAEQESLSLIRDFHGEGKSLREIAEMLNERGVKPKRADRWLHSSVLRILARTA
jgi:hypothetical protein